MRISLFTLFLIFSIQQVQAQFAERMRSARPGVTVGAYTVGKEVLQVQAGYNFFQTKNSGLESTRNNPVIALRYGLTRNFEVNGSLGWTGLSTEGVENREGLTNAQFGCRFNITEEKDYNPAFSIQYRLLLGVPENDFNNGYVGSKIVLTMGNKLFNNIRIRTNVGYTWEKGINAFNRILYAARIPIPFNKKMGTFIDAYYDEIIDSPSYNFRYNTGFYYFVNNDLKLDILGGGLRSRSSSGYYLGIGFSWRTHNRNKDS